MPIDVEKELAILARMTAPQLREKYAEVFQEPSRSGNKQWLIKRIVWRLQADAEGSLSERAVRRAAELSRESDLRQNPPPQTTLGQFVPSKPTANFGKGSDQRLPVAGTVLTRDYKGTQLRVTVLAEGFEFEGRFYKTLTAVAEEVTGKHWSGFHFFKLKGRA